MNHQLRNAAWLLCAVLATASPAAADIITSGSCVDTVSGRSNNCTANDVTFVLVGLGTQTDGCVAGTDDTVAIKLRAEIQNTTAQTRYDVGMYVSLNGQSAKTGTSCARASIDPVSTVAQTCPPLDLDGPLSGNDLNVAGVADGPYLSAEAGGKNSTPDACGDLFAQGISGCDENGNGLWDDTLVDFGSALSFPCRDLENDGFVNIPTCATWGNQANEVFTGPTNDTCDSATELVPGTAAKCRCADTNTTIPAPRVNLACTAPATLVNTQVGTFNVTYQNLVSCTPVGTTPENEQCGAAAYVWYKITYDSANGTLVSASATRGTVDTSTPGVILWIPYSDPQMSPGIIGQGETATLTYTYKYTGNATGSVATSTTTYWTTSPSFLGDASNSVGQTNSASTCSTSTSTTPVTLSSFRAAERGDEQVFTWSTATESANLGFNLYGETADGWQKLNDEPIPSRAASSTAPQSYRAALPESGARRFRIEDVALDGKTKAHGPFDLGRSYGETPPVRPVDWKAVRDDEARPRLATRAAHAKGSDVNLLVDRDGLYRVTYEDLASAGFDLGNVSLSKLALTHAGQPVPIRVVGNGTFRPGDYFEFEGEKADSQYTDTNVYTLSVDHAAAARILDEASPLSAAAAGFYPATLTFNRDRQYSVASLDGDPWYDTQMLTFTSSRQWSFPFDLDSVAPEGGAAQLVVSLTALTDFAQNPDHRVQVRVNGQQVADQTHEGFGDWPISASVPAGLLHDGSNTLTLVLPGTTGAPFDVVDFDRFTLTYPRHFQATGGSLRFAGAGGASFQVQGLPSSDVLVYRLDASGPTHLTGVTTTAGAAGYAASFGGASGPATYDVVAGGSVLTPRFEEPRRPQGLLDGPAELLIVSHPAFLAGLDPLVSAREAQGLSVKVVDVRDVYAAYSGGVVDPAAIRDYVRQAADLLGTRYLLLVGGDTFDYKNHLGLGSVSFIPSLYTETSPTVQFAPADALFGDLDGDGAPDLAVGRLPVRTGAELDAVIAKTLAYEGKQYGRTAVLTADHPDSEAGSPFSDDSERFGLGLGTGWGLQRAYLDVLDVQSARDQLRQAIDDGVALTSFVGHSAPTLWSFSRLWSVADTDALANQGRPTVVVQWGCWNAYYVEPRYATLGQEFLVAGEQGAAAVLGSATLLDTGSARALSEELAPLIAARGVRLGDALTEAKQTLAGKHPEMRDAILGWTLLGDPTLVIEP